MITLAFFQLAVFFVAFLTITLRSDTVFNAKLNADHNDVPTFSSSDLLSLFFWRSLLVATYFTIL